MQSQVNFNRIPEKVPEQVPDNVPEKITEKIPEKVWEALVQRSSSTGIRKRFGRRSDESRSESLGGFGTEPR